MRLRDSLASDLPRVSEHARDALGLALYGLERARWLHRSETRKP
jgi:hypothetical protein